MAQIVSGVTLQSDSPLRIEGGTLIVSGCHFDAPEVLLQGRTVTVDDCVFHTGHADFVSTEGRTLVNGCRWEEREAPASTPSGRPLTYGRKLED